MPALPIRWAAHAPCGARALLKIKYSQVGGGVVPTHREIIWETSVLTSISKTGMISSRHEKARTQGRRAVFGVRLFSIFTKRPRRFYPLAEEI